MRSPRRVARLVALVHSSRQHAKEVAFHQVHLSVKLGTFVTFLPARYDLRCAPLVLGFAHNSDSFSPFCSSGTTSGPPFARICFGPLATESGADGGSASPQCAVRPCSYRTRFRDRGAGPTAMGLHLRRRETKGPRFDFS